MIKHANKKNISTVISTNLSLKLSDEYINQLVRSGLDHIIIAIDGMTQEIYERYRVGGDLKLVKKNIEKIIEVKKRLSMKKPIVDLQFIRFGFNDFQLPLVIEYANQISVDVFTSFQSNADYNDFRQPKDVTNVQINNRIKQGCLDLWATADIDNNGNLYSCDIGEDYGAPMIGSLTDLEFRDLWNGPRMKELRSYFQKSSNKLGYNICVKCPSSNGIPFFLK